MRKYSLLFISILLSVCVLANGKTYVYPDYTHAKIQQIINESDHIIFTKGVYDVDDNTSFIVRSDKKLTFESGSKLDFTNTRARQYESIFTIQGDNVVLEGLYFTSSSRCSRSVYGNGPRDGFSSLCTVIMIKGNNVLIRDCKFYNAEIAVSVSHGDHIKLVNLYGECAQTIFATRCNNLTISNLKSVLSTHDVGKLDHHIYIKGNCKNIDIYDSYLCGGPSYAVQISGDYSDPSISPKNVVIKNVELSESVMGFCIDQGYSNLVVSKINAIGVPDQGNSFFLTNRGGDVRILNSVISNYNYIESETISIQGNKKGSSYFKSCKFNFFTQNVTAFILYYLDCLLVEKCSFYYCCSPVDDGFIVRTDSIKNCVSYIQFNDNQFYMDAVKSSCFRIPSTSTTMKLFNNTFFNWAASGGTFFSKDSVGDIRIKENSSLHEFTGSTVTFKKIRKPKVIRACKIYRSQMEDK